MGRLRIERRVEPVLSRSVVPEPAPRAPQRRDPAPSRAAYRLQRMWLTPLYRSLLRKGLPVFVMVLAAGLWLKDEARRGAMTDWAETLRQSIAERPEFMVRLLSIEGASNATADAIRTRLQLRLPVSSFEMDLDAMLAEVRTLDPVAKADLHIRKGGVLDIVVTERQPVAIWRSASGIGTIDAGGHRVDGLLSRLERPDLPLIVGEGADARVDEALAILAVAGPVKDRIRGLVRIGDRRWDVIVEPAVRLMLPEVDPVSAFEQIIALDQAQELLGRDIVAVDLRTPSRATVRLNGPAAETYRQSSAVIRGAATP